MRPSCIKALLGAAGRPLWLAAFLGAAFRLSAQTELSTGHTDVGIVYEDNTWNLHIGRHEDSPPAEYAPSEAILQVAPAAKTSIPANPTFRFLGESGASIYVLPEVQNPALLFLGLGTEELASGLFLNDQVTLSLKAVTGPGQFFVYDVGALGTPTVFMNSRDGSSSDDAVTLTAGGHRHVNWAFNAPGSYQVTFEASGTLATDNQFTSSGPVTYTFKVLGELPWLQLVQTSNLLHLRWQSELNVSYQIQNCADVVAGNWTDWGSPVPGTGALLLIPVPSPSTNQFFRVVLK